MSCDARKLRYFKVTAASDRYSREIFLELGRAYFGLWIMIIITIIILHKKKKKKTV